MYASEHAPDPITRLTPSEWKFVDHLNATSSRDEVLSELKANLQTAIEIELATIPIYLYSYYSLVRNARSRQNIGPAELFANRKTKMMESMSIIELRFNIGGSLDRRIRRPMAISNIVTPRCSTRQQQGKGELFFFYRSP